MSSKPSGLRCLVLSVDIGAGHRSAAQALCAAVADLSPGSRHKIVEALDYLGPGAGTLAKELYFGVLEELPDLWGMLYQERGLLDFLKPVGEFFDDLRTAGLSPVVRSFAPDVVVAVHPIACGLAAALGRNGEVRCPTVAVLTDFDAHPAWIVRGLDLYLAPTRQVADDLESQGAPASRVEVTGIPLRAGFSQIRGRQVDPADLGLDRGRFTILLLGGGLGLGPIIETAEALSSLGGPLQLVLICGSNRELQREAQELSRRRGIRLHVCGRVDNIWDYISVADLAVGKPGGLTCAELLAAGLPLVALAPIPGQEQANCDALRGAGAALHAPGPGSARDAVARLLSSPDERERMRQAALRLGQPGSAREAAKILLRRCAE